MYTCNLYIIKIRIFYEILIFAIEQLILIIFFLHCLRNIYKKYMKIHINRDERYSLSSSVVVNVTKTLKNNSVQLSLMKIFYKHPQAIVYMFKTDCYSIGIIIVFVLLTLHSYRVFRIFR